jgi:hypothetical protein
MKVLHQEPTQTAPIRSSQESLHLGLITTCSSRPPAVGRNVIAYSNHRTFEISPTQERCSDDDPSMRSAIHVNRSDRRSKIEAII